MTTQNQALFTLWLLGVCSPFPPVETNGKVSGVGRMGGHRVQVQEVARVYLNLSTVVRFGRLSPGTMGRTPMYPVSSQGLSSLVT